MTQQSSSTQISDDQRKERLSQQLASLVASQSVRIESQSEFQAVVIKGKPVNNVLHFLIGLFTCGVWWVVWVFLLLTGGEKRQLVQVDEYGRVRVQDV